MQNRNSSNRFLLLYGSQTGQAEAISEELRDRARVLGLNPDFQCMKGADKNFNLERETLAVIVISTTGDGEPPDTARKLIRRLNKRTLSKDFLKNLIYCLLALGDSNYLNFCVCGKQLDKRLRELGARPFQETSHADDAVGLEVVAEPWLDRTIQYLANFFNLEMKPEQSTVHIESNTSATLKHSTELEGLVLNLPSLPQSFINVEFQPDLQLEQISDLVKNISFPAAASKVFCSRLLSGKKLTTSPLVKEYIELTFQITDSEINYEPGDSFGFLPKNNSSEVELIMKKLGIIAKADEPCFLTSEEISKIPIHLPRSSTLRIYLTYFCDIRSPPKKTLLRSMAEYATDLKEKQRLLELCSRQGSAEFTRLIRVERLSLLDLLNSFPSCNDIPFSVFLENLPRLQPRYYSVASTPLKDSKVFSTVFSVVKLNGESEDDNRTGVCTGYFKLMSKSLLKEIVDNPGDDDMENLVSDLTNLHTENPEFLIFKRKQSNFLLPDDCSTPLIMIGPGAGLAPFLGFLRHRYETQNRHEIKFGETWLYFGCRHKHDYLYEEELKLLVSQRVLNHLRVSFSRDIDTASKYVHHNISEDIAILVDLIDMQKALIYVCGDAKNMSKDVAKAFMDGYSSVKNVTTKEAEQWFSDLQKSKRFIQDVWL